MGRPQLHINCKKPTPDRMQPVSQGAYQPEGGLWTSTPERGRDSFYVTLYSHMHMHSHWNAARWKRLQGKAMRCYLLHPELSARVATIDGRADLLSLGERYGWDVNFWHQALPFGTRKVGPIHSLNFVAMTEDFDAVRVTDRALEELETPRAGLYRLRYWHAESTCWFRWCFERVESLGLLRDYLVRPNEPAPMWSLAPRLARSYR